MRVPGPASEGCVDVVLLSEFRCGSEIPPLGLVELADLSNAPIQDLRLWCAAGGLGRAS